MTIKDMRKDIEKSKAKLRGEPMCENFGQSEVRRIADKYAGLMIESYSEYTRELSEYSEWCANYTQL